jgi:hypothetical protein
LRYENPDGAVNITNLLTGVHTNCLFSKPVTHTAMGTSPSGVTAEALHLSL